MEFPLGRIPQFDARSRQFPIRALLGNAPLRSYTWRVPTNLDQDPHPACTGFAVAQELAARPQVVPGVTNEWGMRFYYRARQLDIWPGEDYEGSSVLAAVQAVQEAGWYSGYRWAFGEHDLAQAVGYAGPAVIGINWYSGMFRPDGAGFLRPSGSLAGGHAILVYSLNLPKGFYRVHNSWGPGWGERDHLGQPGTAKISREDMRRLLLEDGEAVIPQRVSLGR